MFEQLDIFTLIPIKSLSKADLTDFLSAACTYGQYKISMILHILAILILTTTKKDFFRACKNISILYFAVTTFTLIVDEINTFKLSIQQLMSTRIQILTFIWRELNKSNKLNMNMFFQKTKTLIFFFTITFLYTKNKCQS